MKLSEVIKALEDGSKSKFSIGNRKIQINAHGDLYATFQGNITAYLPLDGWEEIKPPRQWSEKELMLFKLLPDWAKWISRDLDDGSVFAFEEEPVKLGCVFKAVQGSKSDFVCQIGTVFDNFLTITHEESPVYIWDMKGE